jgi:hypothetical protein
MDLRVLLLLGLCFASRLSPALSLQCYYGGDFYGGIFPYDIKPTKDTPNPACLRYQLDCTTLSECKAGDNGKWFYTVLNRKDCAGIQAMPAVYKHAKCCTASNCNAPDPTLDTTTKVIPTPSGLP